MGAICNNILASFELGTKAVLSWSCIGWAYPLGWSVAPGLVHLAAAVGIFQMTYLASRRNRSVSVTEAPSSTQTGGWWRRTVIRLLSAEGQLCVNRPAPFQTFPDQCPPDTYFGVFCASVVANVLSAAHLIYSTLVLSSMLFISEWDVIPLAARYAISTMVCRVILAYEIAGMKKSRKLFLKESEARVAMKSEIQNKSNGDTSAEDSILPGP
jgi:hypothetical protein